MEGHTEIEHVFRPAACLLGFYTAYRGNSSSMFRDNQYLQLEQSLYS